MESSDVSSGWMLINLGDLLDGIESGKSFECHPRRASEDEWGVIKVSAMTWGAFNEEENKAVPLSREVKPRHEIRPGDILLSRSNTVELVGASVLVKNCRRKLLLSDKSLRMLVPEGIDRSWLQVFLSSPNVRSQLSGVATGSSNSMRNISQDKVRAVRIALPPLNEQRRIVAKVEELFSDLDAAVAALERVKAKLKRYRAAVLKAAVDGKLTEEWRAQHPHTEPATALLDRILKDRHRQPTGPECGGLSELPERWCWATVEQLVIEPTCNGISVKGTDGPPGVPALRLSSMSSSGFNYDERRYIPIGESVAAALTIQEGDFFVSRGNGSLHLVGRGTLAQAPPERIVFPDTMIRLRFSKLKPLPRFMNMTWQCQVVRNQIEKKARTTAGIYKISQRDVEAFQIPLPPAAEQEQILLEVERRLSVVAQTEAQVDANLKRATRLRQSILKRAFEGRLVPQDPADEPADKLLERIKAARVGKMEGTNGPKRAGQRRSPPGEKQEKHA
jgi:type I restriction enzyme S subunit